MHHSFQITCGAPATLARMTRTTMVRVRFFSSFNPRPNILFTVAQIINCFGSSISEISPLTLPVGQDDLAFDDTLDPIQRINMYIKSNVVLHRYGIKNITLPLSQVFLALLKAAPHSRLGRYRKANRISKIGRTFDTSNSRS